MRDGLVFNAEARREHDGTADLAPGGDEALEEIKRRELVRKRLLERCRARV